MRILINDSFYYVIAGSFVASIARAASAHASVKVSVNWFFPENRPIVSSILLLAPPAGYMTSYILTDLLVTTGKIVSKSKTKEQLRSLMIVEAILFSLMMISAMIFYKEHPPFPPSLAGNKESNIRTIKMKKATCSLIKDKNYMFIWYFASSIMGVYQMISASLGQILTPFQFSSH